MGVARVQQPVENAVCSVSEDGAAPVCLPVVALRPLSRTPGRHLRVLEACCGLGCRPPRAAPTFRKCHGSPIRCNEWDVKGGSCELCQRPAWCDDGGLKDPRTGQYYSAYGAPIDSDERWLQAFDHPWIWLQDRQCKFKNSQRDAFVARAHAHFAREKRTKAVLANLEHGEVNTEHGFTWNEVNMYSGWGDGGLQASLMRNLIGLVDMQGDGGKLDALAHKFAQLGKHVPRFVMRTDGYNRLDSWDPLQGADLRARPYHIYERM